MTQKAKHQAKTYWLEKAQEALASAQAEMDAGRLSFAINRAYYACFYSANALLLDHGKEFSKHSGVKSALHQYLVKPGILSAEFGKIYNRLYDDRSEGDYIEFTTFEQADVEEALADARKFVHHVHRFLS